MQLKDSFNREISYMRISLTDRCNYRCRYCMPASGIQHKESLSEEEIIEAVSTAADLGIRKLRVTGGEPLIRENIAGLCARIAAVPGIEEVCLTTNGSLLPQFARSLVEAGVRRVNISLDSLKPERFTYITRSGKLDDVLRGVDAALSAGFDKVKINTVLIGGFNEDEIPAFCALTMSRPLDVRFIEWMPMFSTPEFGEKSVLPGATVLERVPELRLSGTDGVAYTYTLPDALGQVGLINPLSHQFCAQCNRLRLTADGMLKPCLHSPQEFSIRGLHGAELRACFEEAILAKPERHDPMSAEKLSKAGRKMSEIGG